MSKSYRCDKCGRYFDGASDMQIGHNEELEKYFCCVVGIKFSPENRDSQFYVKDLCPNCADLFCKFWKRS